MKSRSWRNFVGAAETKREYTPLFDLANGGVLQNVVGHRDGLAQL